MVKPLIKTTGLSFSYTGDRALLENVNFQLDAGDRAVLIGANGSGKTTFLQLLVGLLKPDSGSIEAFGRPRTAEKDFYDVRARAGLLFQNPDDQLFCPTVLEDVAFGPLNLGRTLEEACERAHRTLDLLGLSGYADSITYKLSGGEKRLVSLAAVLAMEPEVLLLDEPTAGVDEVIVERITGILNRCDAAILVVTHDRGFAEKITNSAFYLKDGSVEEAGQAVEESFVSSFFHEQGSG